MIRTILSLLILLSAICLISCEETEEDYPVRINVENFSGYYIDSLMIFSMSTEINGYWLTHKPYVFYDLEQDQMGELQTRDDVGQVLYFKAFFDGDSSMGMWIYPHHRRDPAHPVYLRSDDYLFGVIEADTVNDDLVIGLLSTPNSW